MEITTVGPAVLTGQTNVTSTSLAPGPNPVAATFNEVEASFSNPGTGLDTEANEPLPAHLANTAPMALAAPAPSAFSQDNPGSADSHTGEPASLYQMGFDKAQGA